MKKEIINAFSYRISQASKTELIVIMLDMAKQYLNDGVDAFEADDIGIFRENIKNAKRVTDELIRSLDTHYAISGELIRIYMYIGKTLNEASLHKNTDDLAVVENVICRLKTTFEALAAQDDSGPLMGNAQKVYAGLTYSNGRLNELAYDTGKRGFTV